MTEKEGGRKADVTALNCLNFGLCEYIIYSKIFQEHTFGTTDLDCHPRSATYQLCDGEQVTLLFESQFVHL